MGSLESQRFALVLDDVVAFYFGAFSAGQDFATQRIGAELQDLLFEPGVKRLQDGRGLSVRSHGWYWDKDWQASVGQKIVKECVVYATKISIVCSTSIKLPKDYLGQTKTCLSRFPPTRE